MNTKLIATVSAIAGVLIASGSVFAAPDASAARQGNPPPQQQQPPSQPPFGPNRRDDKRGPRPGQALILEGRVQSIDNSTITLNAKNPRDSAGPVVTVNANTAYYVPGVSNATLANVKAGDRVAVLFNSAATSNTPRIASAVSVLPLPESAVVAGTVSNISANGFTLTGPRGNSGTVNTGGAKVIIAGDTSATLRDIQDGARVVVQGRPAGEASVDATLIVVAPQNRDSVFAGVIAAIDGSTIKLFTRDGQQVKVDASSAVIFDRGENVATLADVKAGRAVVAIGIKNADGGVTAQLVG